MEPNENVAEQKTEIKVEENKPEIKAPVKDRLELPLTKVAASHTNPSNMIIFSQPKVGKTSLFAALDKCLILDFEKGTKYLEALKINIKTVGDLKIVGERIKAAGKPYDYIAIDTITALEDVIIPYAEDLYMATPQGVNWLEKGKGKDKYGNILNMPEGAGYRWHRLAYDNIIAYIETLAPTIILSAHVKDIYLGDKGTEFTSLTVDMTGKLKRIATSKSDAIGYLYRKGNQNILTFITKDEVGCGARSPHLSGKEFVISEKQENGTLITHWDKIFIK